MPSPGANGFLSSLLGTIGQGALDRQTQKHNEDLAQQKQVQQVVTAALASGDIDDPNQAIQWLMVPKSFGKASNKTGDDTGFVSKIASLVKGAHQGAQSGTTGASGTPPAQAPPQQAPPPAGPSIAGVPVQDGLPGQQAPQAAPGAMPNAGGQPGALPFKFLTPDQRAQRDSDLTTKAQTAQQHASYAERLAQGREQGLTGQDLVDFALSGKLNAQTPKWAAGQKPVSGKDLLAQGIGTDDQGRPIQESSVYQRGDLGGKQVWGLTGAAAPSQNSPLARRAAELQASDPSITPEKATQMAGKMLVNEARTRLVSMVSTATGKDLSNEQKQRILNGQVTEKEALSMATQITRGQANVSLADVEQIANTIMQETGSSGGRAASSAAPKAESAEKPPVSKSSSAAPSTGAASRGTVDPTTVKTGRTPKLSARAQQTVETADRAASSIQDILKLIPDPNDNSLSSGLKQRASSALYNAGFSSADDYRTKLIQLTSFLRTELPSAFVQGSRAKAFIEQIQQHLPDPTKDTPKLMADKLNGALRLIQQAKDATYTDENVSPSGSAAPASPAAKNPYR